MEATAIVRTVPIIGLRKPIVGLRIPIIGIRKPIHLNPCLNWDDVFKKYNNLIKFAAKQVENTSGDTYLTAEDYYQEGSLLLWKCYQKYRYKSDIEFQYLFKSSLWRHLRNLGRRKDVQAIDIDECYDLDDGGYTDDVLQNIFEELRIKQVFDLLKGYPIAAQILQELIMPSEKTIEEVNREAVAKERMRSQGRKINVPATLIVKPAHIQRALKLSQDIYTQSMRLIQQTVYNVYSKDVEIHNYVPPEDTTDVVTITATIPTPPIKDDVVMNLVQNMTEIIRASVADEQSA